MWMLVSNSCWVRKAFAGDLGKQACLLGFYLKFLMFVWVVYAFCSGTEVSQKVRMKIVALEKSTTQVNDGEKLGCLGTKAEQPGSLGELKRISFLRGLQTQILPFCFKSEESSFSWIGSRSKQIVKRSSKKLKNCKMDLFLGGQQM